jgi:hypothetical protein
MLTAFAYVMALGGVGCKDAGMRTRSIYQSEVQFSPVAFSMAWIKIGGSSPSPTCSFVFSPEDESSPKVFSVTEITYKKEQEEAVTIAIALARKSQSEQVGADQPATAPKSKAE